ncbi:Hypothetical_protein [Hexamita inflata]|uniref:Hypothetical_protein n=1 Tax=Hexamita inflata TaxID=28002 RepID=A0AA86PK81_9EUKA|nr:Hypothetical protein HINF_LOCUS28416 [Hexamita inflata]
MNKLTDTQATLIDSIPLYAFTKIQQFPLQENEKQQKRAERINLSLPQFQLKSKPASLQNCKMPQKIKNDKPLLSSPQVPNTTQPRSQGGSLPFPTPLQVKCIQNVSKNIVEFEGFTVKKGLKHMKFVTRLQGGNFMSNPLVSELTYPLISENATPF